MAVGYDYYEAAKLIIDAGGDPGIVNIAGWDNLGRNVPYSSFTSISYLGFPACKGLEGDKSLGIAALISAQTSEEALNALNICEVRQINCIFVCYWIYSAESICLFATSKRRKIWTKQVLSQLGWRWRSNWKPSGPMFTRRNSRLYQPRFEGTTIFLYINTSYHCTCHPRNVLNDRRLKSMHSGAIFYSCIKWLCTKVAKILYKALNRTVMNSILLSAIFYGKGISWSNPSIKTPVFNRHRICTKVAEFFT